MARFGPEIKLDKVGNKIGVGNFVRVAKHLAVPRANREYRASFRRCAGRMFEVMGWDTTGLVWVKQRRGEVLSIEPGLLLVVRRGRNRRDANERKA